MYREEDTVLGNGAISTPSCLYIYWHNDLSVRKLLEDRGSIPDQVIPKTKNIIIDASLLNTQHYKAWIKTKWRNPGKLSSILPYTSVY